MGQEPTLMILTGEVFARVAARNAKRKKEDRCSVDVFRSLSFLAAPSRDRPSPVQTIVAHREENARAIETFRDDVPIRLIGVIAKMMNKDPADHFQSMRDVTTDLVAEAAMADAKLAASASPAQQPAFPRSSHRSQRWWLLPIFGFPLAVACIMIATTYRGGSIHTEAQRHRDIAKWVIGQQGSVTATTNLGPQEFTSSAELPSAPFRINSIAIHEPTHPVPLDTFLALETLNELQLQHCDEGTVDYAQLSNATRLTSLDLYGSDFGDDQLSLLPSSLETLDLGATQVTAAGLKELGRFINLRALYLSELNLDDEGATALVDLTQLVDLEISRTKITDLIVPTMLRLTNLEELDVVETKFSNVGLEQLASHVSLRRLWLDGTAVTGDGLQLLSRIKNLHELSIADLPIEDAHVAYLLNLPALRVLDISDTNITDEGLQELQALTDLDSLTLSKKKITEAAIDRFANVLPNCDIYIVEDDDVSK